MRTVLLKLIVVLSFIITSACTAIPEGPAFKQAAAPTKEQSLLYFYRPDTPPFLRSPDIYLNETKVLDLKNLAYSYVYVEPRRYSIRSSWSAGLSITDQIVVLDAKAGETYFLRQDSSAVTVYPMGIFNGSFQIVDSMLGMNEIQRTRYVAPVVKAVNTTLASNQQFPKMPVAKGNE